MSEIDQPKTQPPSDPVAPPAPDPELRSVAHGTEYWYVRQEHVVQLEAEGWVSSPGIPTRSGDFAFVMTRAAPQTDAPEEMPDGLRHTPAS